MRLDHHIGWNLLKRINGDDTFKNLIYSSLITVSGTMMARALTSLPNVSVNVNETLGYEKLLVGSFICVISGIVWYIARLFTLLYMPNEISDFDNSLDYIKKQREYIKSNIENGDLEEDKILTSSTRLSEIWNKANYDKKYIVRYVILSVDFFAVALYIGAILCFSQGIHPFVSRITLVFWQ